MLRSFLLFSFVAVVFVATGKSDNWGHWRGPTGNGTAIESNPPTEWSDTKNIKWKVEVPGKGSGSPVIWGNQVFVVSATPANRQSDEAAESQQRGPGGRRGGEPSLRTLEFVLMSFDRATGDLQWKKVATVAKPHQNTHSTNGFSSASPCTDGQHVFAHFGSRGLFCYTMDGELKWKRADFEPMNTRNDFGEGSSPTIAGDKILVPYDHEGQSYLYALNKLTGDTIWSTKRDEPSCWATPLVVEFNGKKQVVMNGQTCARGYDLESGQELWRCAGQTQRPVASAVAGDDLVYVGSGFHGSFLGAFRLDGSGDIEGSKSVVWTIDRDTPDIASPLLSGGLLYFHKGKSGQLTCVDAKTGKPHYSAIRIAGVDSTYASPIAAGGYVYLTGRSGTTVVIKAGPEPTVVSTNSVGETVDATPAPVDNQIFIRGERHLFCIES